MLMNSIGVFTLQRTCTEKEISYVQSKVTKKLLNCQIKKYD